MHLLARKELVILPATIAAKMIGKVALTTVAVVKRTETTLVAAQTDEVKGTGAPTTEAAIRETATTEAAVTSAMTTATNTAATTEENACVLSQ